MPISIPQSHAIELWLAGQGVSVPATGVCEWRIDGKLVAETSCAERVSGPGIELALSGRRRNLRQCGGRTAHHRRSPGEGPADRRAGRQLRLRRRQPQSARRLLGEPALPQHLSASASATMPAAMHDGRMNSATARSMASNCARRLQIAIENPQASVTFLDLSCSGAGITDGILGPQTYVERIASSGSGDVQTAPAIAGGARDSQLYRLMRELCRERPEMQARVFRTARATRSAARSTSSSCRSAAMTSASPTSWRGPRCATACLDHHRLLLRRDGER